MLCKGGVFPSIPEGPIHNNIAEEPDLHGSAAFHTNPLDAPGVSKADKISKEWVHLSFLPRLQSSPNTDWWQSCCSSCRARACGSGCKTWALLSHRLPLNDFQPFPKLANLSGRKGNPGHSTSMHKQGEPEPKHLIVRAGEPGFIWHNSLSHIFFKQDIYIYIILHLIFICFHMFSWGYSGREAAPQELNCFLARTFAKR